MIATVITVRTAPRGGDETRPPTALRSCRASAPIAFPPVPLSRHDYGLGASRLIAVPRLETGQRPSPPFPPERPCGLEVMSKLCGSHLPVPGHLPLIQREVPPAIICHPTLRSDSFRLPE